MSAKEKSGSVINSGSEVNYSNDQEELLKQLEAQITATNPQLIKRFKSVQERRAFLMSFIATVEITRSHRWFLPPTDELIHYNDIIPNGADRIMTFIENMHEEQKWLNRNILPEKLKQVKRGQWFGMILGVSSLLSGVVLVVLGITGGWAAFLLGVVTLGVRSFVRTSKKGGY